MSPLLSFALGAVLTALTVLVLLALVALTALLILLVLLAVDVLLDRNGIDRRSAVLRLWSRLRRPTPTR